MKESAPERFPRLAPILLVAALTGLVVVRPGNLAGDEALGYRLFTTLTSVIAVCYIAWRFHGLLAAATVLLFFRMSEPASPVPAVFSERASDALFLATLLIGLAAGTRQGRPGKWQWLLIGVWAGVASFAWYRVSELHSDDLVAHERIWQIMLLIAVLSAVIGLLTRHATWADRGRLILATIGPPAIGATCLRLIHGQWPPVFQGGDWSTVYSEWNNAIRNGDWANGVWAWTMPGVVAALLLIGVWRTVARGLKEWQVGRPPLAWLLTIASIGVFAALGGRPLGSGSLALAAMGALLSVFGIADLILALVERIELRPPDPGPAIVPKVA